MRDVIDALPREYRGDPWVRALLGAVQAADAAQRARAEETAAQILLDTLSFHLSAEERVAGITPPKGASVQDRLAALAAKWRSGGKVDIDQIQRVCDAWKNGEVTVQYRVGRVQLKFASTLGMPKDLKGLRDAVRSICPAHLAVAYAVRFLLVQNVEGMPLKELLAQPVNRFAFLESYDYMRLLVGEAREMLCAELSAQPIELFAFKGGKK